MIKNKYISSLRLNTKLRLIEEYLFKIAWVNNSKLLIKINAYLMVEPTFIHVIISALLYILTNTLNELVFLRNSVCLVDKELE